jgi:hypothetical protein
MSPARKGAGCAELTRASLLAMVAERIEPRPAHGLVSVDAVLDLFTRDEMRDLDRDEDLRPVVTISPRGQWL